MLLSSFFVVLSCVFLVARLFVLTISAGVRIVTTLRGVSVRPAVTVPFGTDGVLLSLIPGKRGVDGGCDYCIGRLD